MSNTKATTNEILFAPSMFGCNLRYAVVLIAMDSGGEMTVAVEDLEDTMEQAEGVAGRMLKQGYFPTILPVLFPKAGNFRGQHCVELVQSSLAASLLNLYTADHKIKSVVFQGLEVFQTYTDRQLEEYRSAKH